MRKLVLVLVGLMIFSGIAFAEEKKKLEVLDKIVETAFSPIESVLGSVTDLDKIVVTPSKTEEKIGASSSSVSVIDKGDFERKEIDTVKDVLREEVGLDVVQSGAFQGTTSLFTRGGNSNQTLIMIDGIKAYDPISPNGAYNLAHLTLDNVDRIEVLRGPQSALYGSDAMAGVINIMSRKAEKAYVNASYEGGSFFTNKESVEIGAAVKKFHYSVASSRLDTKGISQAEAKNNNQERDPYDRTSVAARVDYDITENFDVGGTFRYTYAHFEYDDGFTRRDDDNLFGTYRETFFTLRSGLKLFDCWEQNIHLGWMDIMRRDFDDNPPANDFLRDKYTGKTFKFDYQNTLKVFDFDRVVIGYDYNEEIGDSYYESSFGVTDQPKVFSREGGFYVENRLNVADRLTATQGVRVSHHSRAGTFTTYRFDGSYLFATGTKVRGQIATGFKAPTLYQLFSPANPAWAIGGGNPNLQPEKSLSYEYGMDQYLFGDKFSAGVTYFNTVYRNLIDAVYHPDTWVTDQYANVGKATVHGLEFSGKIKPVQAVTVSAGVTYQKTKNLQTGAELLRRPENKFFIECFWQALDKLSLDTRIRYNGPMSDSGGYKIKEYTVVDLVLNYDITKNFSIYGKIENALNKRYQETVGYGTAPFSVYGGVKAKF